MTITFTREKDTKNTVRFQENVADDAPTVVGTLYIQKHAIPPGTQTVTVNLTFGS